jgi:peptidoglycan/xylan/chitin deacetylase (PgdA/CDA1 family)
MSLQSAFKLRLIQAARFSGVHAIVRSLLGARLTVLCYHGVVSNDHFHQGDPYRYRNAISEGDFQRHMCWLRRVFHPVGLDDVIRWHQGDGNLPQRPVLVTFDDGYRNNLTRAAPVLQRYGIPAVVFVCTSYIGSQNLLWTQDLDERLLRWPNACVPSPEGGADLAIPEAANLRVAVANRIREACKRLPDERRRAYLNRLSEGTGHLRPPPDEELTAFLSWDEVRELTRFGVSIGSHTVTHPILSDLAAPDLARELADSKTRIECELQRECVAVAYPNGGPADVSPAVFAAGAVAGYRAGFTLLNGLNTRSTAAHALNRININATITFDAFLDHLSGINALRRMMTNRQ